MKNILLILNNNKKRNGLTLVLAVVMGIVSILTFTSVSEINQDFMTGSETIIGVIDYDNTSLSQHFLDYLYDEMKISIIEESQRELEEKLLNYKISAIIEIPKSFSDSLFLETHKKISMVTLDDFENAAFLETYIDTYMNSITIIADISPDREAFEEILVGDSTGIRIETRELLLEDKEGNAQKSGLSLLSGFLTSILSVLCVSVTLTIVHDKVVGTYNRMQLSPVKPFQYILGTGIFGFISCLLTVVIVLTYLVNFQTKIGISGWLLCITLLLFVGISLGVSIVIALITQNKGLLLSVLIGYITLSGMLGGAWFPISEGLGFVSNICYFIPTYWVMDIINNVPYHSDYNYLPSLLILVLFNFLIYLLCGMVFARKK